MDFQPTMANSTTAYHPKKTVRFSPSVETIQIERSSTEENASKWYNVEERNQFKRTLVLDVAHCNRMLAAKAAASNSNNMKALLSDEELSDCVGLEAFFSRNVVCRFHAILEARTRHLQIVLREQARQRSGNVHDVEKLARLSKASSQCLVECSHMIALRYAPM